MLKFVGRSVGALLLLSGCNAILGLNKNYQESDCPFDDSCRDASVTSDAGDDRGPLADGQAPQADAAAGPDGSSRDSATGDGGCPPGSLSCGTCVPNDTHNCGACGHDCTALPHVNGAVSCSAGTCSFQQSSCAAAWSHCSSNADDGCEVDLSKPDNCGQCGHRCPSDAPICSVTNGTSTCASGCSGQASTLCDNACVDTSTNANNCATCGHVCSTTVVHAQPTCQGGMCGFACNTGYTLCAGSCVDEQTDRANCGGCGASFACGGGKQCASGKCGCPDGSHDCNGMCVSNRATTSCGTTSCISCPTPASGSGFASCDGTSCGISCSPNTPTYCPATRACADTATDSQNCGGCGRPCSGVTSCINGVCSACRPGDTRSCGHAAVGICHPGSQVCQPDGTWGLCAGNQEPKARDCSSSNDNDCNAVADNTIDTVCQCAIGTSTPCQTHPGLDGKGPCKAGSQPCIAGPGNSSSLLGTCNGSVGPSTDTCSVTSGDLDCNGIQGDGPSCFATYYVFFFTPSGAYACPPRDWLMQTTAQPPVGYTFLTTVRLPVTGIPIYSCENGAHLPEYASGDGCGLMPTKQISLGNGSAATGGNGWVALDYPQVTTTTGATVVLPHDDPHCCNCQSVTRRDAMLSPLYTVP